MPKKSKSRVKRARPLPQATGEPGQFLRRLFQPRGLMMATAVLMSGLGLWLASGWLPDLTEREEYLIDITAIEVTQPPPIVPVDFVKQAFHRADLPNKLSLLDESLTEQIAEALQRYPWVAHVRRITKSPDARIVVELDYRHPVAMVEVTRGVYPVDAEGVLLPPEDFTVNDAKRFLAITGVVSTPQGPEGTSWGDSDVEGAAALAALLSPYQKEFQLKKIDCPAGQSTETSVYSLITMGGSKVLWGAAPGEARPGEPDAQQKIDRIKKYLKRFGDFQRPAGPYEIDIRHWQEISRRPMTAGLETPLH